MTSTIIALLLFFGIAFAPKVPWFAKMGIQIVLGLGIYFGLKETEFMLPKVGSMYGGNAFDVMEGVAWLSMGVLGTGLGLIATLVATILYKVFGKSSDD